MSVELGTDDTVEDELDDEQRNKSNHSIAIPVSSPCIWQIPNARVVQSYQQLRLRGGKVFT